MTRDALDETKPPQPFTTLRSRKQLRHGVLDRCRRRTVARLCSVRLPKLSPAARWSIVIALHAAGLIVTATLVHGGITASLYVGCLAYGVIIAPTLVVIRQVARRTSGLESSLARYHGWFYFARVRPNFVWLYLSCADVSVRSVRSPPDATEAVLRTYKHPKGLEYDVVDLVTFANCLRVGLELRGDAFARAWHEKNAACAWQDDFTMEIELRYEGETIGHATVVALFMNSALGW